MNERIIICGYPKSGNTWLTRLTAEIVGCPVAGFWCEPFNNEQAIEGLERESKYKCFKSHHSADQIQHTFACYANGSEKLIYIMRDPRDIIVSARHYFRLKDRYNRIHKLMSLLPIGSQIYYRLFHTQKYALDTLTKGLLKGTNEGAWLGVPWKQHVMGYLNTDTLVIKYESLRDDPLREAKRICKYLNIERSDNDLTASIQNQSFEKKKKILLNKNQLNKSNFLRKGISGEWKKVLSANNIKMISGEIGEFIEEQGYQ